MPWIESHQTLSRHPKMFRAAKLLGVSIPTVIGHLHLLWWWCLDYAEDGDLSGLEADEIAKAAHWDGDSADFVEALLNAGGPSKAGFLEHSSNGHLVVHDWEEYTGLLIARRRRNAQQKRDARRLSVLRPKDVLTPSEGRKKDVPRLSGATVPTNQPTVPNQQYLTNTTKPTPTLSLSPPKKPYGEFANVLLSDEEYQRLEKRFGPSLPELIEALSVGIASKGYKYRSHYAALLAWQRKDKALKPGHIPADSIRATPDHRRSWEEGNAPSFQHFRTLHRHRGPDCPCPDCLRDFPFRPDEAALKASPEPGE